MILHTLKLRVTFTGPNYCCDQNNNVLHELHRTLIIATVFKFVNGLEMYKVQTDTHEADVNYRQMIILRTVW